MSTWPDIPGPLFGPSVTPTVPVIRTEMDSGRPRQRMRYTQTIWTYTTKWFLTDPDLTTFLTWWRDTIHMGADWFSITLVGPSGEFTANARFVGGVYSINQANGGWSMSANIELDRSLPQ